MAHEMTKARTERWAVEAPGLTKANPTKTISAHSASPGYLPKIAGNKDGNSREAKPSAMTATTYTSSHNLFRDVPIDVIQKLAPNVAAVPPPRRKRSVDQQALAC